MAKILCFAALCLLSIGACSAVDSTVVYPATAIAHNTTTTALPTTMTAVHHNTTTVHPTSTTVHHNTTTVHPTSTTAHHNMTTVHPTSTTAHHNTTVHPTSTVHHNTTVHPTSTVHHNTTVHPTSTVHHNTTVHPTSTVHHNTTVHPTSTVHHNTTVHPTSTVHHNTTATVHPTSTTPLPTTAFHNRTVSTSIFPTATISPTMVTSVMPSSSPTPPPPPPQPKAKFSISKNGTGCLLLWMSLRLTISYKNISGNMVTTNPVQMPAGAVAQGSCEDALSFINVQWPKGKNPLYSAQMWFTTAAKLQGGASGGLWQTKNITISVITANNTAFVAANETLLEASVQGSNLEFLSGKLGHSLNCTQEEKVTIGNSIMAEFSNVRAQPFEVNKGFSSKVDTCEAPPPTAAPTPTAQPSKDKPTDHTVAIAVGCSLAGLVVIVLIGYFIGRRRKRNGAGYRKL